MQNPTLLALKNLPEAVKDRCTSLQKTPPEHSWQSLKRKIANELQVPTSLVSDIEANRAAALRNMQPMDARAKLILQIPQWAKAYGAYEEVPMYVLEKAINLILTRFSELSIADIQQAYESSVSAEQSSTDAKMYAGTFNVANLAAVLRDYSQTRRKVIAAIEKEKTMAQMIDHEQSRAASQKAEFENNFRDHLRKAAITYTSYADVPHHLYEAAIRLGYYEVQTQEALAAKRDAWERSDLLAVAAIGREMMDLKKSGRHNEARVLDTPEVMKARRILIAQKIIIFEQILKDYR